MEKKYILTDRTKEVDGHILHRIQAIKDFGNVHNGDLGGWIESEDNLSQEGECWVRDEAMVYNNAVISDGAVVFDYAVIRDNAVVSGDVRVNYYADICGDAVIKSDEDYVVHKNTWSSGRYFTYTRSNDKWRVGCFYGTSEELIAKAYEDSEKSGKCYEAIVRAQELIAKINN